MPRDRAYSRLIKGPTETLNPVVKYLESIPRKNTIETIIRFNEDQYGHVNGFRVKNGTKEGIYGILAKINKQETVFLKLTYPDIEIKK